MNFDIFRVLLCSPFLLYSCYTDLKERRVPNRVWLSMAVLGALLDVEYLFKFGLSFVKFFLIQFIFIFIFSYLLYRIGAYGGADAKALMALAIFFPLYPAINGFPILNEKSGIFTFTVFSNSVILTGVLPVAFFIYNISRSARSGLKSIPRSFVGYQVALEKIPFHAKLMEYPDDGKLKKSLRGVKPEPGMIRELKRMGIDRIWVTPGIPFLIPITAGFYTAIVIGDILFNILSYLLPP